MLWTDGGCITDNGVRVAGMGIFYGAHNPRNSALQVDGQQTAPRAELSALTHAPETDTRSMCIRSDCRYVVDGYNQRMQRHRARAWMRRPLRAEPIMHHDLWRRAQKARDRRDEAGCITQVEWVKAHSRRADVDAGVTTRRDAWGNSCADALATAACKAAAREGRATR